MLWIIEPSGRTVERELLEFHKIVALASLSPTELLYPTNLGYANAIRCRNLHQFTEKVPLGLKNDGALCERGSRNLLAGWVEEVTAD